MRSDPRQCSEPGTRSGVRWRRPGDWPLAWRLLLVLLLLTACKRQEERELGSVHATQSEEWRDRAERILPGPKPAEGEAFQPRALPVENPFGEDLKAIQEGRRLFQWMNCNGCHAEGGGSIGPILWDDQWRYGGRGVDIAESILYGRPDGMPAYAGHLPEDQVWRIVAYVQSMEPRGGPFHSGLK